MSLERDPVELSSHELRILAGLDAAAAAADPGLEERLVAGRPRRVLRHPRVRYAVPLLVAGGALAILTIGISVWLALAGVLMMTLALEWIAVTLPELGGRLCRWMRSDTA